MTPQSPERAATQPADNMGLQPLLVSPAERAAIKHQRPMCVWFTGLSGAGSNFNRGGRRGGRSCWGGCGCSRLQQGLLQRRSPCELVEASPS